VAGVGDIGDESELVDVNLLGCMKFLWDILVDIAILNDLLDRVVLMNFREIELLSISKKFKKYFDSRERLT
jgi:hypothetical protein